MLFSVAFHLPFLYFLLYLLLNSSTLLGLYRIFFMYKLICNQSRNSTKNVCKDTMNSFSSNKKRDQREPKHSKKKGNNNNKIKNK